MSRVGKMPVAVPAGVDVSVKEDQISVKGSGGTLALTQNALVKVTSDAGKLSFVPANDSREANAMSGTMRQLVNNMVVGVTKGFEKKLSLIGVGYKAQAQGAKLNLTVGWPPRFVRFGRPSPIRARVFAMRTKKSRSKKPRRSKGQHHVDQKTAASSQIPSNPHSYCHARRCTFDGKPYQPAHLRQCYFWRWRQGASNRFHG